MFNIRAGTSKRGKGGKVFKAKNITIHPMYDSDTIDYDVAVIQVKKRFKGTFIQPVGLSDEKLKDNIGESGKISGWGHLEV